MNTTDNQQAAITQFLAGTNALELLPFVPTDIRAIERDIRNTLLSVFKGFRLSFQENASLSLQAASIALASSSFHSFSPSLPDFEERYWASYSWPLAVNWPLIRQ